MTLEAARSSTIRQVRQYARRQLTWFRRDRRVHWIAAELEQALALAEGFLGPAEGEGRGLDGSGRGKDRDVGR
jgi:tRNA dimethylallyltransferase